MKKIKVYISVFLLLFLVSCKGSQKKKESIKKGTIISTIVNDKDNFYHVDMANYPFSDTSLPIGVFDSGTGGLTVLKAIVNYDKNKNISHKTGRDGILDFDKESFIYLGDQANMPYGNYPKENKVDLLKEHIIKDAQFLMNNKYYSNAKDALVNTGKKPVKVLVIACNTATAYGKEYIEEFLKKANANLKVIGVIDAGVRGTLSTLNKEENAIIGVLATAGTVTSKGYHNTIVKFKDKMEFTGNIEVFSQGGIGIAEAVDEDPNYFNKNLKKPRVDYKGPDLKGDVQIDKTLFDVYNFDFNDSKMLCDSEKTDDCSMLQINDAENYVRYHLVSLLEQIRLSKTNNKLKSIILGCTHYPYLITEISAILKELYNYKGFNLNGNIKNSEFYISVANKDNTNNVIDKDGRFPYAYKYGRNANEIQEYVKVVPFSRKNISDAILMRFQKQIPYVYQLMQNFNNTNPKTNELSKEEKI
jgi:glutamate racemase